MRKDPKFFVHNINQKEYMKKLSFKSPPNRKSKIEPRIEKINSDDKDHEYLPSE